MNKELKAYIIMLSMAVATTIINIYHLAPSDNTIYWYLGDKKIDDFFWFFSMWLVISSILLAPIILMTKRSIPRIGTWGLFFLAICQAVFQFFPSSWPHIKTWDGIICGIICFITIV